MKTKNRIVIVALIVLLLCSSCAALSGCQKSTENEKKFSSIDEFGAAVIGDTTVSVLGALFKEGYPDAVIKYYDDNSSVCAALLKGGHRGCDF